MTLGSRRVDPPKDAEVFFSGADVQVWMMRQGMPWTRWNNVMSVAWNNQAPVMPHYNFDEIRFENVSFGSQIVQGQISVVRSGRFVDPLNDFVQVAGSKWATEDRQRLDGTLPVLAPDVESWYQVAPKFERSAVVPNKNTTIRDLPRGPFRIQLIIAPEALRQTKTLVEFTDGYYGSLIVEAVYFTGDSPLFANQTADALTANYSFLAKGISRTTQ